MSDKYVSFKELLAILLTITAINISAFWGIMQMHSQRPHIGAALETQLRSVVKQNEQTLNLVKHLVEKLP